MLGGRVIGENRGVTGMGIAIGVKEKRRVKILRSVETLGMEKRSVGVRSGVGLDPRESV